MSQAKGFYNIAALVALVNAIMHFGGSAIAGFDAAVIPIVLMGVLWLLFAIGMKARQRWLAYFAFLIALVGGLFVYSLLGTKTLLPQWLILTIAVFDLLIALILFLIIWRKPEVT